MAEAMPDPHSGSSDSEEEPDVENVDGESNLESELSRRFTNCTKNPGHKHFYESKTFGLADLPSEWREPWVVSEVQQLARQVVHLTVSYTSPERPDNYKDARLRGTRVRRCGTGLAKPSWGPVSWSDTQPCPIPDCRVPGSHHVTAEFVVRTAAHVVFDNSECKKTEVKFYLDSDDKEGPVVVKAQGVEVFVSAGHLSDKSEIYCVSHDLDLFRKLKMHPQAEEIPPVPRLPVGEREPLVVIISHPHGLGKYITCGAWTGVLDDKKRLGKAFNKHVKEELPQPYAQQIPQGLDLRSYLLQCQDSVMDLPLQSIFNLIPESLLRSLTTPALRSANPDSESDYHDAFMRGIRDNSQRTLRGIVRSLEPIELAMEYSAHTCPGSSGGPVFVFFDIGDKMDAGSISVHSASKRKTNIGVHGLQVNEQTPELFKHYQKLKEKLKPKKVVQSDIPLD